MKKILLSSLLILLTTVIVHPQETLKKWQCPEGYEGQHLDVFNWFAYFAEDTLANFAAACSVEVHLTEFDEEGFMYDTLRLGNPGYDISIVNGAMLSRLISEQFVLPINHDLIPNIQNIDPNFLALAYDPENAYSLPYMWGSVGIYYQKAYFPSGIQSWDVVWNYEGNVTWLDANREILGIGLRELGYSANSTNASEILEARDFLGEHSENLLGIYGDGVVDVFKNRNAEIIIHYSGLAYFSSECQCDDYGYSIPDEGSNIYIDNMIIPIDSDAQELAMVFMDYILDAKVNADISNMGSGSVNRAAYEAGFIDLPLAETNGYSLGEDLMSRMFFLNPIEEETLIYYDVAWDELLTLFGENH